MTKQQMRNRNNAIILTAYYEPELTLAEIGGRYHITRQRVSKILKANGIDHATIKLRQETNDRLYQEACEAARRQFSTISADGKQRAEYRVYANMLRRCFDPNNDGYADYGGRGITVCEKWRGKFGFRSFLLDMGPRPGGSYANGTAKYSLHRINNEGSYEPSNCKWATQKEQCGNRRKPNRGTIEVPLVSIDNLAAA